MASAGLPPILGRMVRAAKLDVQLYEEVEHDPRLTGQAALVVVIASGLCALGTALLGFHVVWFLASVALNLLAWVVFAFLSWIIGTRVFKGTADMGEMLRVLGFASAPLCLGIVPYVGAVVGGIWTIVASVIAMRQGLDISTEKAVITAVLSMIAYFAVAFLLAQLVMVS